MDRVEWTVADHLYGKPPASVQLYHRFVELVTACGPFTYAVAKYTKRLFVHQFRLSDAAQLDDEFARWVAEAYRVGGGGHLSQPR